jgi:hypothetical protein
MPLAVIPPPRRGRVRRLMGRAGPDRSERLRPHPSLGGETERFASKPSVCHGGKNWCQQSCISKTRGLFTEFPFRCVGLFRSLIFLLRESGMLGIPRKRAVLTRQQAVEIFNLRGSSLIADFSSGHSVISSRSVIVSQWFGVSPKTVRDIWNLRTWRHLTSSLFPETERIPRPEYLKVEEDMTYQHMTVRAQRKGGGRPRGSKDSKPRQMRRRHHNDAMRDNTSNASQKYTSDFNEHGSDIKYGSSSESASEVQSTAQADFGSLSCIHTTVASLSVSMPHWDHFLALDATGGAGEGKEASLHRSYPFFLQC